MNVEKLENNEINAVPDENPVETIDEDMDDLDNMEMQELPISEDNMNSIPMFQMGVQSAPNVNNPYYPSHMSNPPNEQYEMQMEVLPEENSDMIEDIQIDDNNAMRGFYEDSDGYNYTGYYYRQFNEPDEILENIKQYNPNVFRRFASLGIPFPLAQNMVRGIIKLTLNYSK